ncbi:protocadherin Fat 4-like [Amia ocellicauda]|uniref:protocadherin Fat 4-like n=1 Tax=Amia ocellicauda TaxID=2972642 RepID=UPI003463FC86
MGTSNFSHFLFIVLIGHYCFYTSVDTTRINCLTGGNVQLETKPDEYDGIIETIIDVPTDTGLEIIDSVFPGQAKYVELVHTPGSADAIVQTKGPLNGDKIQPGGKLYYNIRCLDTLINNTRILPILDINDNNPVFEKRNYNVSVPETISVGSSILKVTAVDLDTSSEFNSITYTVVPPHPSEFEVRVGDGSILLKQTLNYNRSSSYSFTVKAQDRDGNSDQTDVLITVEDVDNLSPYFLHSLYNASIHEHKTGIIPTILPEPIEARDGDLGLNVPVDYSISTVRPVDYTGFFTIDTGSGILSVVSELDREIVESVTINIQASQRDDALKTADATVVVNIEDVNDNEPTFDQTSYNVSIPENCPNDTTILRVIVTDLDQGGFHGELRIIPDSSPFTVTDDGSIKVKDSSILDREITPHFSLKVEAVDTETNGLSATAVVNITILDINDNNPQFNTLPQNISIPEGDYTPDSPGEITQIIATDSDAGENGHVTLSILSADPNALFHFQEHGTLIATGRLDRESKDLYELVIVASDNGIPQRTAATDLTISVLDVNDNPPVFTESNYTASLNLTSPARTFVTSVSATDQDSGSNAVVEYYVLDEDPDSKYFIIEDLRKGAILTKQSLPRPGSYRFSVEARDRGDPPLNSTASVFVDVIDNGMFMPEFNSSEISERVEENTGSGHLVYTFSVLDTPGVSVNYSIINGNELDHFRLNANTSELYTTINLDFEQLSKYIITVEAIGFPSTKSSPAAKNIARLTILVEDVNEAPEFSNTSYSARIFEVSPYKTPVVKVKATDPDSGEKGLLVYSLNEPKSKEFDVDSSTGQVYVVSLKSGTFTFQVNATDLEGKGLSAVTSVEVSVEKSSYNDVVVISINVAVHEVEIKNSEVQKALQQSLGWNIHIIEVNGISHQTRSTESRKETYISFIASNADYKIISADEVKRELQAAEEKINNELQVIFGEGVYFSVKDESLPKDPTLAIAAGVLVTLGLVIIFLFFEFQHRKSDTVPEQFPPAQRRNSIKEGFNF